MTPHLSPVPKTVTKALAFQTSCISCHDAVSEHDLSCESCGYPLRGSDFEQRTFINHRDYQQLELQEMNHKIHSASQTLYVLAAIAVLYGIIGYAFSSKANFPVETLMTYLGVAAVYFVLALWSKVQPVTAIITALILYVLLQVLVVLDKPTSMAEGIIIKIVVVAYLVKGIKSAMEAQKIRRNLILRA